MLKININSITVDPEPFQTEVDPASLDLGPEALVREPAQVEFQIHRMGEKVYIRGEVTTSVDLKCARCLAGYTQPLRAKLTLLAVPGAGDEAQAGANEQPLGEEDPTLIYYAGDQLDLLSEVRGALILALPMKPLCAGTCPGLCPHCGARLAEGPCACPPPGPFSDLKNYQS